METGRLDQAILDDGESIRCRPDDPIGYFGRAVALQKIGKTKEPQLDFARSKQLEESGN